MVSELIQNTVGAALVSALISFFLMGLICTTVYSYYKTFPNDRWYLRGVVLLSFVLSAADTAVDGELAYRWCVSNYSNPAILAFLPKEFSVMLALLGFVPFVVQTFFAWRLWKISSFPVRKYTWIIPALIGSLSAAQLGVVLSNVYVWEHTPSLMDMATSIFPRAYAWIACLTAADLLISCAMIYYLVIAPRKTSTVPLDSQSRFVDIARRAVETNTVTLIIQIALVCMEATGTGGLWYLLLDKITVKSYLFALISSLNARQSEQGIGSSASQTGIIGGTQRYQRGDVKVTVVEDVQVDSEFGSIPMNAYHSARAPVNLHLTSGRGNAGEYNDFKNWADSEAV